MTPTPSLQKEQRLARAELADHLRSDHPNIYVRRRDSGTDLHRKHAKDHKENPQRHAHV